MRRRCFIWKRGIIGGGKRVHEGMGAPGALGGGEVGVDGADHPDEGVPDQSQAREGERDGEKGPGASQPPRAGRHPACGWTGILNGVWGERLVNIFVRNEKKRNGFHVPKGYGRVTSDL